MGLRMVEKGKGRKKVAWYYKGKRLKSIREERKVSLRKVSDKTGISLTCPQPLYHPREAIVMWREQEGSIIPGDCRNIDFSIGQANLIIPRIIVNNNRLLATFSPLYPEAWWGNLWPTIYFLHQI